MELNKHKIEEGFDKVNKVVRGIDENDRLAQDMEPVAKGLGAHWLTLCAGTVIGNIAMLPIHGLVLMVNTIRTDIKDLRG